MCWKCYSKPVKQIAEKDIPVFKIMSFKENELRSFYTHFKYEIGKLYTDYVEDPIEDELFYNIRIAFHSYSNYCKIEYGISILSVKSFNNDTYLCDSFNTKYPLVKVNCVIPKGSIYYVNEYGEYVSDRIKIIDI